MLHLFSGLLSFIVEQQPCTINYPQNSRAPASSAYSALYLQPQAKVLSLCFLLKLMLRCTFHLFVMWKVQQISIIIMINYPQNSTDVHKTEYLAPCLRPPFVTSQMVDFSTHFLKSGLHFLNSGMATDAYYC